ncbi:MAG TPA: nucleoside triphosphate pyrophosphohydrolase [Sphaerochaeta sp.]|nr:nucleoside triphosphate pyrophosphohydrolase [Sphaerochaeta sp.]
MISFQYQEKHSIGDAALQLYEILSILRGDGGCPWDQELTFKESALNLIEETYEFLDAQTESEMVEELGDVLLNAFMLLVMAQEHEHSQGITALNTVCEKLIRRHPHVFGEVKADNPDEVLKVWNAVKEDVEGRKPASDNFFSNIPRSTSPLEHAFAVQKQLEKVGFDWPTLEGVVDKIQEELGEVLQAHASGSPEALELELGDLLFSVINLTRFLQHNPAYALHRTNQKVQQRFNALYEAAQAQDVTLSPENLDAMEALWQASKEAEEEGNA